MNILNTRKNPCHILLLLLALSLAGHAASECNSTNPYIQQTCESLNKSAFEVQKSREEEDQKQMNKQKETVRKQIEEENKPTIQAPPPESKMPEWQKALKQPEAAHPPKNTYSSTPNQEESQAPQVRPLPPPDPTEFSNPEAVTLPGGVNIIPKNPDQNQNKARIKYY